MDRRLNPALDAMVGEASRYYWSVYQSEWASDVLFRSPSPAFAIATCALYFTMAKAPTQKRNADVADARRANRVFCAPMD